jgi:hypothetical protein
MTREVRCSIGIRGVSISTDAPADGRRPRPQRRLHALRSAAEDDGEESEQASKRG